MVEHVQQRRQDPLPLPPALPPPLVRRPAPAGAWCLSSLRRLPPAPSTPIFVCWIKPTELREWPIGSHHDTPPPSKKKKRNAMRPGFDIGSRRRRGVRGGVE